MFFLSKKSARTIVSFCLLFFTFSQSVLAQNKTDKATITSGPEVEAKRSNVSDICGYDASGYYTIRMQKRDIFIEHINKQMAVDKSVQIPDQKDGENDMDFDYVIMLDGNLYLFTTSNDSKANKITLFVQGVSTSTLLPDGKPKEITSATYATRRGLIKTMAYTGALFSHNRSPDGTRLLVYNSDKGKDENDEAPTDTRFHLTVFDGKMAKQWDKDVKLPFAPSVFSVEQIKVDDEGSVYVTGIEYQEKSEARSSRREGKPTYIYHIYRYASNGTNVLEMPVDLKGKFITDLQVDGAPNGDVIAAGFYSEIGTFAIKGAFYISIDGKTHDIKTQQYSEFETDFITQYASEKEKKKAKKKEEKGDDVELANFRMDELLIRQDGGATMIAEQFYTYTVTTTTTDANGHSTTTTTTYYNYNDILVISFNPDGKLAWKTKVPKRQTSTNDGGYYSSYTYSVVGDKIYFIFNDNPKNLFLKEGEKPYTSYVRSKEQAVVLVEVDANGKFSRELLMTTEKGDLIVRPKICEQTGAKEVLICSEKSKVYQFSKVEFK
jgi:hypothetical protein